MDVLLVRLSNWEDVIGGISLLFLPLWLDLKGLTKWFGLERTLDTGLGSEQSGLVVEFGTLNRRIETVGAVCWPSLSPTI